MRLEDKVSILLTTEKPIYQPGQTIHVRALALDRANHAAAAGRKLTFEVEDSRGNKVFKKATQTDKFGIASAEFALADEVNLGTYHLRALMDARHRADRVERGAVRAAQIQSRGGFRRQGRSGEARLSAGRSRDGNGPRQLLLRQAGGRRGDHREGVGDGCGGVRRRIGARQDRWRRRLSIRPHAAQLFRRTSALGRLARVLIEATVKDSAGHAETRGEPITVSESPLILTAVPEGGTLIPDLENQIFILASYADGKPATRTCKVDAPGNPATECRH